MALVTFAKVADLQKLVPSLDDATAQLVLEQASSAIRESVGWDVDKVTGATYAKTVPFHRRPACINSVVLPVRNLTAVASVVVDGATLASTGYAFESHGIVYLQAPATQSVVVTYTAGYPRTPTDSAPPAFRSCALEYAAQLAGNPGGVKSYQMGQVQESFAAAARELADGDPRLDAYRV